MLKLRQPLQMRQLFQNLIGNALKFARPGVSPAVRVSAAKLPDENTRAIVVEDNGIGLDPKETDRIFGVFERLHSRTEYEGSGIGLALCRRIAERHGGTITAESQPGEGARFTVTLPVSQLSAASTAEGGVRTAGPLPAGAVA